MKIITTSDWHIGNIFHGNDRLPEHKHFLDWLLSQIEEHKPDALLVAGDVFDNSNPSAAAQSAYYKFIADATRVCPEMRIIITAGNHDSANRLEAPRALLTYHNVEVRGIVHRYWQQSEEGEGWAIDYDDLMIPTTGQDGIELVVLAVPFLRNDIVQNTSYSAGVNAFLHELTDKAREKYPSAKLVMMAHMYAKGAEIAQRDASEKIVVGGQEEVSMDKWTNHPDYMTCGHIHKRQHIWNTDWARYTGSVLPMSFAEIDYHHGVDLVELTADHKPKAELLEYTPQHRLRILPEDDRVLTPKKLKKLITEKLKDRKDGKLDDDFEYVVLKVSQDKFNNDEIKELETLMQTKNAVLCKIQKTIADIDLTTISTGEQIHSIDDILNRDPMDTLKEAFYAKNDTEMSEHQEQLLRDLLQNINNENE